MLRWLLTLPLKLIFSVLRLLTTPGPKRAKNAEDAAAIYLRNLEELHGADHVQLSQISYSKTVEKV